MKSDTNFTLEIAPRGDTISQTPSRVSISEMLKLKMQLEKLQEKKYLRPSVFSWKTPSLVVKKKDDTLYLCIDYKQLNKVMMKNKYQLPRSDDPLDRIRREKVFSRIELRSSNQDVRIMDENVHKTVV